MTISIQISSERGEDIEQNNKKLKLDKKMYVYKGKGSDKESAGDTWWYHVLWLESIGTYNIQFR